MPFGHLSVKFDGTFDALLDLVDTWKEQFPNDLRWSATPTAPGQSQLVLRAVIENPDDYGKAAAVFRDMGFDDEHHSFELESVSRMYGGLRILGAGDADAASAILAEAYHDFVRVQDQIQQLLNMRRETVGENHEV